jgi:GNAT superfamily N-acetyltransferase
VTEALPAPPGARPGFVERWWRDIRTFPGDARSAWGREGWSGVWAEIRPRTIRRVYWRNRLFVVAQELAHVPDRPAPPGVRIERFDGPDWSAMTPLMGRRKLLACAREAARGRLCLVAWRGERPLGYTWIAPRTDPRLDLLTIPLPQDAAYLYDLYVLPSERSHGIGSALVSARLAYARDRGYREGWRIIATSNAASLRTLEKTSGPGTRTIGEIRTLKLWRRYRRTFIPYSADAPAAAGAA